MRQIIKRTLIYFLLLILVSFALPRIIPGNPLYYFSGDHSVEEKPELMQRLKEEHGLGEPLGVQFRLYLSKLLRLDLGKSFYFKTSVADKIWPAAVCTLLIAFPSIAISLYLGLELGINLAMHEGRKGPALLSVLLAYQAIPSFLLACLAQLFFCYKLKWFPASGAYSVGMRWGDAGYIGDVLRHLFLPLLISTTAATPSTALLAYNASKHCKKQSYVRFAIYQNLDATSINDFYIKKNILPEILGKINIQIMTCLSGSLFVEAIFSYPGLGTLMYNASIWRDYPLLQGLLLVSCSFGIIVNAISEIILNRMTLHELMPNA